jgi:hypothetical protein
MGLEWVELKLPNPSITTQLKIEKLAIFERYFKFIVGKVIKIENFVSF